MNLIQATNSAKKVSHPILIGLTYALAIVIVGSLITALLLSFTSLSDSKLSIISFAVTGLSLLIGGFIAGKRAGLKGWYYGGLTGLIFGVIISMINFLAFDLGFNLRSLILILLTFLFGAFGGVLGVNSKK